MTTYLVHRSDNATSAAQAARVFLESRPIEHNVILTLLRDRIGGATPGRYWWISENGVARGMAMQSPLTFKATMTPMPLDAVGPLVDAVAAEAPDLPGIIGDAASAAVFAGAWTERRSTGARPVEGQRIYRLGTLRLPEAVPGTLRVAGPADLDQVVAWFVAFQHEVTGLPAFDEVEAFVSARMAAHQFWMWERGGEAVSAAMVTLPIAGAARISFVYTPPAARGHGYAAATVAGLCAAVLADDRPFGPVTECLLYTQLHNATSNRVYRRIGFRAVAEVTAYAFDPI